MMFLHAQPANITLPSVNHCNLGGGGPDGALQAIKLPLVLGFTTIASLELPARQRSTKALVSL
eukprot:2973655-Amphidinium_carterae.1